MKAKRSVYTDFQIADLPELDETALDRGEVVELRRPGILGFSALTAAHHRLTEAEVALLARLPPTEWADIAPDDGALADELARHGFLVIDSDDEPYRTLRERDNAFTAGAWAPEAACYHFSCEDRYRYKQSADYDAALARSSEHFTQLAEKHGPPPPAFWEPEQVEQRTELPLTSPEGQLYDVLTARRSVRKYTGQPLTQEQLSTLLRYVWGCHGTTDLAPGIPVLRKTVPAGGSMHPNEVYPVIRNVEGLDSGIYHYSSEHHALGLLERMDPDQLAELAVEFSHGQLWLGDAPAIFVMTSRWTRHLWKYRNVSRAYTVMLMDAAHLSQTFYLVATQLGLGACFTGALDAPTIEQQLGLDGITQGPAGIIGCGHPSDLDQFPARPFLPVPAVRN